MFLKSLQLIMRYHLRLKVTNWKLIIIEINYIIHFLAVPASVKELMSLTHNRLITRF